MSPRPVGDTATADSHWLRAGLDKVDPFRGKVKEPLANDAHGNTIRSVHTAALLALFITLLVYAATRANTLIHTPTTLASSGTQECFRGLFNNNTAHVYLVYVEPRVLVPTSEAGVSHNIGSASSYYNVTVSNDPGVLLTIGQATNTGSVYLEPGINGADIVITDFMTNDAGRILYANSCVVMLQPMLSSMQANRLKLVEALNSYASVTSDPHEVIFPDELPGLADYHYWGFPETNLVPGKWHIIPICWSAPSQRIILHSAIIVGTCTH